MNDKEDELVIDQSNFDQYFFDIKKHGPTEGQIMARFCAKAQLMNSVEKQNLVDVLLTNKEGAEIGVNMSQNTFSCTESEAVKLCKEIVLDLLNGKSKTEVLEKPYTFTIEKFFWTREEYVPKNNPHWKAIKITVIKEPEKTNEEE